jgi:hypothetical protein
MSVTKRLPIAVGVLTSVVLASPVSADEFTDSLASLKRAMAGHWSGALTGIDNTGERFEAEDAFTYVVTTENGLDSATWSAGSLEIAKYEGDGRYSLRSWSRAGRQSETPLRVRITEIPDAAGKGAWVLELEQRASDGTMMEAHEHFTLDDNSLHMTIVMRPAGSNEPFETKVTGTWERTPNR